MGFPIQESKEFEEEIRQEISIFEGEILADDCSKKREQLYCIIIDFYLSRTKHSIRDYSNRYGQAIEENKGKFGTPSFDFKSNKEITSSLYKIASYVNKINNDLKEARLTLDKVTSLVYRDYHNKSQDNQWLEITGSDNLKLLSEFLDHLKNLGEWHNNKLKFVTENNVKSGKTKTDEEKVRERKAFDDIKLCVNSIGEFISVYNKFRDETNIILPVHQEWCILYHPEVVQVKIPEEFQTCSC